MLELLTGTGLAAAAGLNAYIPLLIVGLGARFTDFITLPAGWAWLSNEWVLVIVAMLLVVELVADKIPVVDSVNDWLQSFIRPAAGGLVFGSGATSETVAVTDPSAFADSGTWIPIVTGIVIALVVHLAKMMIRPALNAVTAGIAAPALSTAEDAGSLGLAIIAILIPVLVVVAVVAMIVIAVLLFRGARRRQRRRASTA